VKMWLCALAVVAVGCASSSAHRSRPWLGDAAYARGDWARAAAAYERELAAATTDDSSQLAAVKLRWALAVLSAQPEQGRDRARRVLEELRRAHPGAFEAQSAAVVLARLDQLDAVERSRNELREQRTALRLAVERLGELATALKERADSGEAQLALVDEERDRLQKRLGQLEASLAELRSQVRALEEREQRLTEQLDALKNIDLEPADP